MPLLHPTKTKGDLAVAHAYTDLTEQGYLVLWPTTEHAPFDLVAYRDGDFLRIQVKHRSPDRTGALRIEFKTSWVDRNGSHRLPMDKSEVDLLCAHCPTTGHCYYIRPSDHGSHVSLRLAPARNNQSKGVLYAESFRWVPDPQESSTGPRQAPVHSLGHTGGLPLC